MNNQEQQQPNGDRMERVERAIEQLVNIQASHDARVERITSAHADHAARQHMAENRLDRIEFAIESLVNVQQRHEQELDGLMEIVQRHSDETAERFRNTGDKLNALIQVVDDIVRKRPPA